MLISALGHMHVCHAVKTHWTLDIVEQVIQQHLLYVLLRGSTLTLVCSSWFGFFCPIPNVSRWLMSWTHVLFSPRRHLSPPWKCFQMCCSLHKAFSQLHTVQQPLPVKNESCNCYDFVEVQNPQQLGSRLKSLRLNRDQFGSGSTLFIGSLYLIHLHKRKYFHLAVNGIPPGTELTTSAALFTCQNRVQPSFCQD